MKSNLQVFRSGWNTFKKQTSERLESTLTYIMQGILHDALQEWQSNGSNLTGNTRASFVAVLYKNTRQIKTITSLDLGVSKPVATEAYPGMGGFTDVDTGEYVESVKPYSRGMLMFQPSNHFKTGDEEAAVFAKGFDLRVKEGYTIMVACAVPYAEYLANKVGYSVLLESLGYAEARMESELKMAAI